MKKVYEIKAVKDNGYGRGTVEVLRRLYTTKEEAERIAAAKVEEILNEWPREWWMHYEDMRHEDKPTVWAEALEVEGL